MIRGLLFDFDGVLVPIDSELKRRLYDEILQNYCTKYSVDQDEASVRLDAALSASKYDEPYLRLQDAAVRLGTMSRKEFSDMFTTSAKGREFMSEEAIKEMLQSLGQYKLALGVVTLTRIERIELVLKNTGLRKFFDFVDSASKEFLESPPSEWKKKAYRRFLDKYKLDAHEVLCVGDSPSIDLQPAKSFGMTTVLIVHDENRQSIRTANADHVFHRDTFPEKLLSLVLEKHDPYLP